MSGTCMEQTRSNDIKQSPPATVPQLNSEMEVLEFRRHIHGKSAKSRKQGWHKRGNFRN